MKKFIVPVNWQVSAYVVVKAENEEEAAHEAMGVDLDLIPNPEYVCDSFEVDFEVIEEVPVPPKAGQRVMWNDPDDDICSGPAVFKRMAQPTSFVAIIEKDGVEMECFIDELTEMDSNKFDENTKGDFSEWDKMPGGF